MINEDKIECIWLPGQSGKTRNVITRIRALEGLATLEYDCESFLNIIISSNNRALVAQTGVRMNHELFGENEEEIDEEELDADAAIQGSCFSWFSGLKKNNISPRDLSYAIIEDEVTMIICCAHGTRLRYLDQVIQNLEKSKHFNKKINIWIDEADATIKLWSKPEIDPTRYRRVNKLTLVSATYDSILKRFGKIRVLPADVNSIPEVYHHVKDCCIFEKNLLAEDSPSYLQAVMEEEPELCLPGVRLFAPGDLERKSHDAIANFLASKGFAVVILNGARKEIIIPNRSDSINLQPFLRSTDSDSEEIGKIISRIYHDNNLSRYPFGVTGHLCLGRGITFQNENFMFTHGVIFDIPDKANAYQTACRMAGNIKGFANYKVSSLYTTTKMCDIIIEKEHEAVHVARLVREHNLPHVDEETIAWLHAKRNGKIPLIEDDFKDEWIRFDSIDDLNANPRFKHLTLDRLKQNEGGFYKVSMNKAADVYSAEKIRKAEESSASKITFLNGQTAANLPVGKEHAKNRLYPYYLDLNNKDSLRLVVRSVWRWRESQAPWERKDSE